MIAIIDYKAGNAPSVMHATRNLGYKAELVCAFDAIRNATHIILPGVGSAKATMKSLQEMDLISALEEAVLRKGVYFLGICIGMQILFEHSEEDDTPCLGWLKGRVVKFDSAKVRVPQIGWNKVCFVKNTPCGERDDYFYFVNSYRAKPEDSSVIWGEADYDGAFAAAVAKDNIYGTQFHAEKSGPAGLSLMKGFLEL